MFPQREVTFSYRGRKYQRAQEGLGKSQERHPAKRNHQVQLPMQDSIQQAAAEQPWEGLICACPLSLSKDLGLEEPVLSPSMALCLLLFIRRMNETFHTPAQFGTDSREALTGSKTNRVQHLGTRRGGQEEVTDGELGGFK